MNYKRIYKNLIKKRRSEPLPYDVYGEKHHIIPVSLGGNNSKKNLIRLSAREHYIAHLLLFKIFKKRKQLHPHLDKKKQSFRKMSLALNMMSKFSSTSHQNERKKINSHIFQILRQDIRQELSKNAPVIFTYQADLVREMCDYYLKHNCAYDDKKFEKLKSKFKYNGEKKAFKRLCNRNGIDMRQELVLHQQKQVLSNVLKNKDFYKSKYNKKSVNFSSFEEILKVFSFYIEQRCAFNKDNYKKLQEKFNYPYQKKSLVKFFNLYGLKIGNITS